ncbi:hypothetical protein CYMTET_40665 [Cymbomonas tetramitiformis]|uniref:PiggyBac transposable element-derived protein domain-containing protein n=1 Tax=Cymbomonas tetramitiformis TaxID=36881 RepID=A0AAE0C7L4_9CHLO|nr:hypothetical protein CYMTET_40665 [Cymbomonas tetramitiformis]
MSFKRAARVSDNLAGKVLKTPLTFFDVAEQPGKFFRGVVKKKCSHKPGHWAVRYTDGTEYNLPESSIKKWICSSAEVKDNSWAYELSDVDSSASASQEVEDPSSDNTPSDESEVETDARHNTTQGAGPSRPAARANSSGHRNSGSQSELYASQKKAGELTEEGRAHKRYKNIANVISSARLQQFWRFFHAADNSKAEKKKLPTGEANPNYDNLYKTRVIHDSFNANLVAAYRPKKEVTIDESCGEKMEGKDGEGAAKCYNKDKPKQRHNKQYALNEASTGIPMWFEMHRSKENMVAKSDKGKMFDICQRLVTNGLPMEDGRFLGHNLGTDNAYTSDQLAVWCKKNGLNFLGTAQLNRCDGRKKTPPTGSGKPKWVPVITVEDARGSFASATTKVDDVELLLSGYQDNKLVYFVSNYHASPNAENGDTVARWDKTNKEYIEDYDVLKTGTDVFDQYLQQIENELTTYRPWMVHYKGLFREAVTTAHLYYKEWHGDARSLLDSSLELAEYFLERADELDQGKGRNKARFGHSFDGSAVCKPVWSRYAEDEGGAGVPLRSSCRVPGCEVESSCRTYCQTCYTHVCLGACFQKHMRGVMRSSFAKRGKAKNARPQQVCL